MFVWVACEGLDDLSGQPVHIAVREAAKKNGATTRKPKRRPTTVVRRDGREPLGLGAAIGTRCRSVRR
ncbi:hypothetical protein ACH4E8_26750 [Streptomyces sp. NPDC017979]|uniref:hypothetical protein n=1 Tax=Streptomyces sp. NPDC017979 TaxID=3365024 RepID=UPI0037B252D3